jgi:hypothetical protein
MGALKPDLVASKDDCLLVLELKPRFSKVDVEKCRELASNQPLINSLLDDLASRRKWPVDTSGLPFPPRCFLTGVAYEGEVRQLEHSACFALSAKSQRWSIRLPLSVPLCDDFVTSLLI